MLYHVIRRPPYHNSTKSSDQLNVADPDPESASKPKLMPRYHYSRVVPNNANNNSDSLFIQSDLDGQNSKPIMTVTTTTTSNNMNNNNNSHGSFKSTFIPLVNNTRTSTPNRRDFIQIPVTREDGTPIIANTQNRALPVTIVGQTSTLPPTGNNNNNTNTNNNNNNNENTTNKSNFIKFLRPGSKYRQNQINDDSEPILPTLISTSSTSSSMPSSLTTLPRLPPVTRRLSLTIPVVTTTVTTNIDDDMKKSAVPSSPMRQIPIQFPQTTTVTSTPTTNVNASIMKPRSSSLSNPFEHKKVELQEESMPSSPSLAIFNPKQSSFDFAVTTTNSSPIRRAEAVAREAIQGKARLQQQQNGGQFDNNIRSPNTSRRVIINLKNNQSVSLDSRLSSPTKPPPVPSSSRITQRNNFFHIPVLHEIQVPSHPAPLLIESTPHSISASNTNNENYKNEFLMEIPVTINASNDQENRNQFFNGKEDGINSRERIPSANHNSNQALKSILKRSSSRDTVSRKNVSFVNA